MGDKIETLSSDDNPFRLRKRIGSKILKECPVSHGRILTLPKAVEQHSRLNDIKKIAWILEDDRLYVEFYGREQKS